MSKQEIETGPDYGHTRELSVFIYDHVPSWQIAQKKPTGTAVVRFEAHKAQRWLEIHTTENSEPGKHDRRTTRETMVKINEVAARALYEQLKAIFEHGEQ